MHVTQPHSGNVGFGCSQDVGLVLPHGYHMVGCKFMPTVVVWVWKSKGWSFNSRGDVMIGLTQFFSFLLGLV